jgi:crossover junction endodeoxyribonuclease RuvC
MKGVAAADPGLSGGIALIGENGLIMDPMPIVGGEIDVSGLKRWFAAHAEEIEIVLLERAQPMPKQGISSAFNYGRGFGRLEATILSLGLAVEYVQPRQWAKVMHAGLPSDLGTKEKSTLAVATLFPAYDFRATDKSKKPHLGMVEAALLAMYGWRRIRGQV